MPQEGVAQFVRSNFDEATTYGAYYMGLAMNYAQGRLQMQDLYAADATKANILAGLTELDPKFCYYLGHGNADVYTAQNQEVVFQTCTGNEAMTFDVVGSNLIVTVAGIGSTTLALS